jgi:hypothetical protein
MKKLALLMSSVALLSMMGGCYHVQIISGKPAGAPAPGYDERFDFGLVAGIIEIGGPYNLDQICPQGWASAESKFTFVSGIINILLPIGSVQSVRITCTGGGAYNVQMNEDGTAQVLEIIERPPAM